MTPEGRVKGLVKNLLRKILAYWHCPVQNGMGAPALDFHVCIPIIVTPAMVGKRIGLYAAIETKAPGKHPTPRQVLTIKAIEAAGGKVLVIDGDPTAQVTEWLSSLQVTE
jgi:hypothetical protein